MPFYPYSSSISHEDLVPPRTLEETEEQFQPYKWDFCMCLQDEREGSKISPSHSSTIAGVTELFSSQLLNLTKANGTVSFLKSCLRSFRTHGTYLLSTNCKPPAEHVPTKYPDMYKHRWTEWFNRMRAPNTAVCLPGSHGTVLTSLCLSKYAWFPDTTYSYFPR